MKKLIFIMVLVASFAIALFNKHDINYVFNEKIEALSFKEYSFSYSLLYCLENRPDTKCFTRSPTAGDLILPGYGLSIEFFYSAE